MVCTVSPAFERCDVEAVVIKRTGGVCWLLLRTTDVMKEENDSLKPANYQSRAWHKSQKIFMTEFLNLISCGWKKDRTENHPMTE